MFKMDKKFSNMETTLIQTKLKLLFEKMTESGYVVNNYYADSVITKLSSKTDPETQWLEKSPILSDLLIKALESTESSHITVKVFIIRVLATISNNELHFGKIFTKESDHIIKAFRIIDSNDMTPSLKVAFMEVALAISTHNSGVTWLLQTEVWRNILNLSSEKQTVFVVRQTYKFANIFLWQLNDMNDRESLTNVLNVVLKPLITTIYTDITSMSSEEEEVHNKRLEPMLQIILSLFKNDKRFGQKTLLLSQLINNYNTISSLYATLDILHTVSMTTLIAKVVFWLHVAKVFFTKPLREDALYKSNDIMEMSVVYFNIVQHFIKRRLPVAVLDFCIDCSVIWSEIWPEKGPTMKKTNGKIIELQSQLVVIPLCPIICYIFTMQSPADTSHWLHDNNILKEYICKLLEYSCEHTIRAAYSMRDLMREVEMTSVVVQSLKRLSCLKNYINNHQANLIFQALFHCLKNFTPMDEFGVPRPPELYEDTSVKVVIMTYVMETVLILLKDFNINWHDSIEVLCLYNVVSDIIKKQNLSCRFLVTSLKVIAVTVMKFQPPNLSLLVDSTPGSAINELGSMIYMKLHERHWEIRDSALELMLVCTEISFIKFPPFQKQIKDNNLIDMAAVMALNDPEVYVQASALKCVGAATKLGSIWEQLTTSQPDIQEKLINQLRHHDEGIVRKEAANVLCDMYINLKLTPDFKSTLHRHMTSAALADFHWEVQIAALRFWKEAIQTALSEQGMLDGTFPAVTFAKESRKIVTLNDKEIQRRLVKCLEELASIGCLTVLSVLLDEDTETEIMNAALTISLELLEILNKYKVPDVLIASEHDKALFNEIVEEIKCKKEPNGDEDVELNDAGKSESIIEGILNSSDINLLANIYENQLTIKKEEIGDLLDVKPRLVLRRLVTPTMFVFLLNSKDFKGIIDSKRKWERGIRSLSSLLDDVLGIYEYNDEVNTLDCY